MLPRARFASSRCTPPPPPPPARLRASFYISNVLPVALGHLDPRPLYASVFEPALLDRLHAIANDTPLKQLYAFAVDSWEVSRKDGGVFMHVSYRPPPSHSRTESPAGDTEEDRLELEELAHQDPLVDERVKRHLPGKLFIPHLEASAQKHGGWPSWLGRWWAERADERHVPGHTLYSASPSAPSTAGEESGILRKGSKGGVRGIKAAAGGGRIWVVKGKQWTEDMNRFPSNRVRVEFDGPDVSQEMIYTLFRPYGRLADIQPPGPVPAGSLRYATVVFSRLVPAAIAINALHGYTTATNTADFTLRLSSLTSPSTAPPKMPMSRLRLYYDRPLKAHAVRDWVSGHPRLVLPVVAFLIGTLSYTFFDPIRSFFVRSKLEGVWDIEKYSLIKTLRARFSLSPPPPSSDPSSPAGYSPELSEEETVGKNAWKDRIESERTILQSLKEWPNTFIVVSGPSGSGKEGLVKRVRGKVDKPGMVIDCEEIAKAKNDADLISALANQTGYYPVFSFMSSLSSLIDLASLGIIGQKAGFSTPTDQSLRQILDVVSSALKSSSVNAHNRHQHLLERHAEEKEVEREKARRTEMVRRGWRDGRLDCVAGNGLSELGGGDEPWNEQDWDQVSVGVETPVSIPIPGNVAPITGGTLPTLTSTPGQPSSELDAESEALTALPIIVLSSFAQKSARGDLYNVLAEWAASLIENRIAHVIVVTEGPTASKVLTKALPAKPLSIVGLSDADNGNALAFVRDKLRSHSHSPSPPSTSAPAPDSTTTLAASDAAQIAKLGGRMVDLESLVSKVRLGSTIADAVDEIVLRNVVELRKAAFGDDAEDAKSLSWDRAQAWKVVSLLATEGEIPYAKLLQEFPFKGAEQNLKALEEHELVSVTYIDGRASTVKPGKPVFRYAFKALVNDPVFRASCQIDYNTSIITKAESDIHKYESELQSLKNITADGGSEALGVSGRWLGLGGNGAVKDRGRWLLDKMGALVGKIDKLEKENEAMVKVLSSGV